MEFNGLRVWEESAMITRHSLWSSVGRVRLSFYEEIYQPHAKQSLSVNCKHYLGHEEFAELYELHQVSNSETPIRNSFEFQIPEVLPPQAVQLLQNYKELFLPSKHLPPHRVVDHKIHLLPNTKPINVRPYRYPH